MQHFSFVTSLAVSLDIHHRRGFSELVFTGFIHVGWRQLSLYNTSKLRKAALICVPVEYRPFASLYPTSDMQWCRTTQSLASPGRKFFSLAPNDSEQFVVYFSQVLFCIFNERRPDQTVYSKIQVNTGVFLADRSLSRVAHTKRDFWNIWESTDQQMNRPIKTTSCTHGLNTNRTLRAAAFFWQKTWKLYFVFAHREVGHIVQT